MRLLPPLLHAGLARRTVIACFRQLSLLFCRPNCELAGVEPDMLRLREAKCAFWFTLGGAALMFALVVWFYAAHQKDLTMRIIADVNPLSGVLPRLTENWRPNATNVRLYDGLVVLSGAVEGLLIGFGIDIVRAFQRRICRNK